MNISKFFIDRPVFAGVLSIIIFVAGLLSLRILPISEYPNVVPPTVVVNAKYPGANPAVIAATVATPLEEAVNGVEDMLYMSSQATTDGNLSLTITFKLGTDPDRAQQLVQNRVSQAEPRLPEEVRRLGITTLKSSPDLTMVVNLVSPNNRYDVTYLRNYGVLNIKDRLARLPGVGQVRLFGAGDYAMRVWLDPQKVAERGLSAGAIVQAIREQNIQAAVGVVGASPGQPGVDLQLPINAQGRLSTVEEFGNIIVKTAPDGAVTRLRDLGRIEMGAAEYALRSLLDGKPAVAIPISQAPGSNAIQISDDVRATMEELKTYMPEGIDYEIVYDPTQFVRASIKSVIHTLFEAVGLVVLVVILFLQTWRASIIPLLAVPVSIVGTFAVMHLLGVSINALSLFGLVLAIGIVVDDAIVVVENVERNIEEGLSPKQATYRAMREVSGPIIAIALVLVAVFVPLAFVSGLSGRFYEQFALTIAISTVISAINSLTLSPALAALLLKGHDAPKDPLTRGMDFALGWLFRGFNRLFSSGSHGYGKSVRGILSRKAIAMGVYAVLLAAVYGLFQTVPGGFVPQQDKQYMIGFAQLPAGATLDRTEDVVRQMSEITIADSGVDHAIAFPGLSISGFSNSSSAGIVFASLKPFEERTDPNLSAGAIAGRLNRNFAGLKDAYAVIFPPPPILGLGTTGGFKLQVEDRASHGYEALDAAVQDFLAKGFSFEWTDLTYQQILAGNSSILVFPLAILLVFLVLAAQYESLTLPLAIIMIVPMSLLAAMTGVWLTGGDNNIFTQIGLIVLVGLSAKNAILIVEFARELEFTGKSPYDAAVEASKLRLRPILMTSMAFIMGVVPLVLASGAGAEMRHAMGVAVFSGMIGVTAFGIFLTPVFYVLIRALAGNRPLTKPHDGSHGTFADDAPKAEQPAE